MFHTFVEKITFKKLYVVHNLSLFEYLNLLRLKKCIKNKSYSLILQFLHLFSHCLKLLFALIFLKQTIKVGVCSSLVISNFSSV